MDNAELKHRLESLFPIENLEIRKQLVSALTVVLREKSQDSNSDPASASLQEPEHFQFFGKELLNQPLLMNALFPGKSSAEVRRELRGINTLNSPSITSIYSALCKNIMLEDLDDLNNDQLMATAEEMSAPQNREFIWKLMTQNDADEIAQRIEQILDARRATPAPSADNNLRTSDIEATFSVDSSESFDPYFSTMPRLIREFVGPNTHIKHIDLSLLIYSGLNSKTTPKKAHESIQALRFIYHELQKNPADRTGAFQNIIDETTHVHIDALSERLLCKDIVNKLKRHFNVGVEEAQKSKKNPTQEYRKQVASMHPDEIAPAAPRNKPKR